MSSQRVPDKFQPFEDLVICSNRMIEGIAPFELKGTYPLLVGKGPLPTLWVQSLGEDGTPIVLVAANVSQHPLVSVSTRDLQVEVRIAETLVIRVEKHLDELATIDHLDLRPIGLKIHGDEAGLTIGSSMLTGNHATGTTALFGIG